MAWQTVAVWLANLVVVAGAAPRPHIVFVLADDYGWGNLGLHRRGGDSEAQMQARAEVSTPNLDSLADEGILINRHYSYKICSPARSSLQSGRLAVHVNTENTGVTVINATDPVSGYAGIPRNMTGLAQKMREAGYRTHMVGKWDAGMATPEHTPEGRGYESWVGYFQHANDYWRKNMPLASTGEIDNCLNRFKDFFMHNATYRGGVRDGKATTQECVKTPEDYESCYEEYIFKQRALQVVREHDTSKLDAPLFLFYAFHLLHTPLQIPASYLNKIDSIVAAAGGKPFDSQNRRLYAAMVFYLDEAVGELVKALKSKDMWEDTLIIFAADNGGPVYEPGAANNHPLKGGKYSDWEGGVRTNSFVSGGFVPSARRGTSFEGVVSIADWYGTLAELAGTDAKDHAAEKANEWLSAHGLPLLKPVDSVAQWAFILNGTNGRKDSLHLSEQALLRWPFKLIIGRQVYSFWQGEQYPNCSTISNIDANDGPSFQDIKIFNTVVKPQSTPEAMDRVTRAQYCDAGCLFNVDTDPAEHNNLAGQPEFADTLAALQSELKRLNSHTFQPGRGNPSVAACNTAIDIGGFYGPFVDVKDWYSPLPARSVGQIAKDLSLKLLLKTVDSKYVEEGIEKVSQMIVPLVSKRMYAKIDVCFANSTLNAESVPTLVI